MAAAEYYSGACMDMVPKHLLAPQMLHRVQTEQVGRRKDDASIAQGRIMWLPAMEDLPERAVRRAHGKGAVEDGIYNHPIVIVSRPLDDERCVHFHLVGFQSQMRELLLIPTRSLLCKARSSISSIPNQTNSTQADALGTCPSHQAPTILMQARKRQRNAFQRLYWRTARLCDGIHMSIFDMSTRLTGPFSNLTRT